MVAALRTFDYPVSGLAPGRSRAGHSARATQGVRVGDMLDPAVAVADNGRSERSEHRGDVLGPFRCPVTGEVHARW